MNSPLRTSEFFVIIAAKNVWFFSGILFYLWYNLCWFLWFIYQKKSTWIGEIAGTGFFYFKKIFVFFLWCNLGRFLFFYFIYLFTYFFNSQHELAKHCDNKLLWNVTYCKEPHIKKGFFATSINTSFRT